MTRTGPKPTAKLLLEKIERLSALRFLGKRSDWRFERLQADSRDDWRWRLVRASEAIGGGLEIGSPDKVDAVLTCNRLTVVPEPGLLTIKVEF